ncbi:MAG: outer membrane beta-barrel protein [Myxococcales bacterium]|nr:outer membrane beta-barrel protein [Myxococcales bacterium]
MNRARTGLCSLCVLLLVTSSTLAFAKDEPLQLSGYVDGRYFFERSKNGGAYTNSNTFQLYEAQINLARRLSANFEVHANLNYRAEGPDPSSALGLLDHAVDQAYLKAMVQLGKFELYAQFGKFNAPIGTESVEAPDKNEISFSLVNSKATPTNVTGLLVGVSHDYFELALFVVNGWDQLSDPNADKTFGLSATVKYQWLAVGVGVISGKGAGAFSETYDANRSTVLDVNLSLTPLQKKMLIVLEGNVGFGSGGVAEGKRWWGVLALWYYEPIKYLGVTLRYSLFRDRDGLQGLGARQAEEATIALQSKPLDSVRFKLEYRSDLTSGSVRKHTAAFQGVFLF